MRVKRPGGGLWSVGGETRPVLVDEGSRLMVVLGRAGAAAAATAAFAGFGAGSWRSPWIAAAMLGAVLKKSDTLIVSNTIFTFGWTPTSVTAWRPSPADSDRLMRNERPVEFTYFTSLMSRMKRVLPLCWRV